MTKFPETKPLLTELLVAESLLTQSFMTDPNFEYKTDWIRPINIDPTTLSIMSLFATLNLTGI